MRMELRPDGEADAGTLVSVAVIQVVVAAGKRAGVVGRGLLVLWLACLCVIPSIGVQCGSPDGVNGYGSVEKLRVPVPKYDATAREWMQSNSEFLSDMMRLNRREALPVGYSKCGVCQVGFETGDMGSLHPMFVNDRRVYVHVGCIQCDGCGISWKDAEEADRRRKEEEKEAAGADGGEEGNSHVNGANGKNSNTALFERWVGSRYLCHECWDSRCMYCFVGGATEGGGSCSECREEATIVVYPRVKKEVTDAIDFLTNVAKIDTSGISNLEILTKGHPTVKFKYKPEKGKMKTRFQLKYVSDQFAFAPVQMLFEVLEVLRNDKEPQRPLDWKLQHTWVLLSMAYTEYQIRKMLKKGRSSHPSYVKRPVDAEESRMVHNVAYLFDGIWPLDLSAPQWSSWEQLGGEEPWRIQPNSAMLDLLNGFVQRANQVLRKPLLEDAELTDRRRALRDSKTAERQRNRGKMTDGTLNKTEEPREGMSEGQALTSDQKTESSGEANGDHSSTVNWDGDCLEVAGSKPAADFADATTPHLKWGGDCPEVAGSKPAADFADATTPHLNWGGDCPDVAGSKPAAAFADTTTSYQIIATPPRGRVPDTTKSMPKNQKVDGRHTTSLSERPGDQKKLKRMQGGVGGHRWNRNDDKTASTMTTSFDRFERPGDDSSVGEVTNHLLCEEQQSSSLRDTNSMPQWMPKTTPTAETEKKRRRQQVIAVGKRSCVNRLWWGGGSTAT